MAPATFCGCIKIRKAYEQLIAEVEAAIAPLIARHRAHLRCRPGCSLCCKPFSVLPLEAAIIRQALEAMAADRRALIRSRAEGEESCPLLRDQLCTIYPHRPLICRTQGLALAYVDHQRQAIEVSACPENFPDNFPFEEADLLFMDPFNAKLAGLNELFCTKKGMLPERRIPIVDIVLGR